MVIAVIFSACSSDSIQQPDEVTLTLGAYTVPREVYEKEIIPAFQKMWMEKTGQSIKIQQSYIASGAQSRAIEQGFEADIAALSLEEDIDRLRKCGLITHDWKQKTGGGYVTRSLVVVAYREGNPKNLKDWEDLARKNVDVLYPSPKTSGGAMWDIISIYGAGLKMSEAREGSANPFYARKLLKSVQKNVRAMAKSGRASVTAFENGIGDALVTYENEIFLRRLQGRNIPFFIPKATVLIENPIAVIDAYVDKHGTRSAAEAFVDFTLNQWSQKTFMRYGFRPVIDVVKDEDNSSRFPQPEFLFNAGYLGGWDVIRKSIFGPEGVWTIIMEELGRE